jgi:hypothetical protein
MKNWVVVANASRARVLEKVDTGDTGDKANFVHVADLDVLVKRSGSSPIQRQRLKNLAKKAVSVSIFSVQAFQRTAWKP